MPFASTSLAARIERAECRLITDGTHAVARRKPDARVAVLPVAGGVATYAVDGSPLNKLAGLGFGGPVDVDELAAIERAFDERGCPLQVEIASLADPSIGPLLSERGYVLRGFENVLGRDLPRTGAPLVEGVEVRPSGPAELDDWVDVVVTGFCAPDTQGVPSHESFPREILEDAIRDMATSDGFLRYFAYLDGELAGGGSMRISEGVAQLCGAATLPALRRRGVQTALLAERLAHAAREGCDVAVVTTTPGSKSQENTQRRGFELLYTRAVLVRPVP